MQEQRTNSINQTPAPINLRPQGISQTESKGCAVLD